MQALFEEAGRYEVDFSEVKGQEHVKRALEVATAGGHNVIMAGPPGSGKTMLAKRLPTILPPMSFEEALETTKIHSIHGSLALDKALIATRPFRSPHHSVSDAGLIGGGAFPKPGGSEPVASRNSVPRRAAGILPQCARKPAPTIGGWSGDDLPRLRFPDLPQPLHADRGGQSLKLRCSFDRILEEGR